MSNCPDGISAVDVALEISTDGVTFEDISGQGNTIEPGDQTRMVGSGYAFGCDTAIITSGKREEIEITVNVIYTEVDGEAFDLLESAFENNDPVWVRWFPKGKADGNFQFDVNQGILSSFQSPSIDASSADPLIATFTVTANEIVRSVYTPPPL